MNIKKPVLAVTAALIRKGKQILIAQRKPEDSLGGLWELPGGKIKLGESEKDCMRREIREELDFEITVLEKMGIFQKEFSRRIIKLHVFECQYAGGEPKPIECADWRWVTIAELPEFQYSEFEWKIIKTVLNLPADLRPNTCKAQN